MKIIHIGGAKGVGKTTTLDYLQRLTLPSYTINTIALSTFLYDLANKRLGKNWQELDFNERATIRKSIPDEMLQLQGDAVILDSHYIDMVEGSPKLIVPVELHNWIDVHIIIEANTSEILSRRLKDQSTRKRDLNQAYINTELVAERSEATALATRFQKPIYFLYNSNFEATAYEIMTITERYLSRSRKEDNHENFISHVECC